MANALRRVLLAVVVIAVVIVGAFAVGVLGVPSVTGVKNQFGAVNETTTTIETDLTVTNPNPVGIRLGGTSIDYTVRMNDITMAGGTKAGVRIGRGDTTIESTTAMRNERIPAWWVSHIRNGERTVLELDARVRSSLVGRSASVPYSRTIETDLIGQFNSSETRPVNANQPIVPDPVLYVNRTGATWGSVSQAETPIDLRFVVYNPKPVPYAITEIGYDIIMNNISVGRGTTEEPYVLPPGEETTIASTMAIRNERLDEWWVSHLRNEQVTTLRMEFYARIELPTGETVRIPLDALTYTKRIETDVFGEDG